MKKIISYPVSVVYYLVFLFFLLLFHPIQWICFTFFGYTAHKKSVDYLNFFLVKCTNLLGTTYHFSGRNTIPKDKPVIFVANHQSMYDIIGMIWYLRAAHPKFVSKAELGKGIPSVSYNLRHGGSVLIDRKDPKQALSTIQRLATYIQKHRRAAVIFPEGTRSKNGTPKKFSENGLKVLCKYAPDAVVVPVTINNSWKMTQYGSFPMGLGTRLQFIIHPAISVKEVTFEELIQKTEQAVINSIKN